MTSPDFAQAQQRLAVRRRQRLEAEAARQRLQQERLSTTPARFLPQGIRDTCAKILGREGTKPAFRVGQVDAELLDEELLDLLKGQVGDALKYYGSHIRDDWTAEIQLALRAVLFKLTIWDHDASYGASLQGLRYTDARDKSLAHPPPQKWQKGLYGLCSVGGRYAWTKWENFLLDKEGSYDEPSAQVRRLSRLSDFFSTMHSVTALASFLIFLVNGKYRTLLDRALRMRLAPTSNRISREVSFEYLNRQLVWHAFTEFLLFVLPLVGISRWRRWLSRAWRKIRNAARAQGSEEEDVSDLKTGGPLGFLPERTCAICYQDQNPTSMAENEVMAISASSNSGIIGSSQTDITNPYEAIPCGCIYCFVCIAQRIEAEEGEGWVCLRCGDIIKECKPWNGDVLEEVVRPSTGKSVGFADETGLEDVEPKPLEEDQPTGYENLRQIEPETSSTVLNESHAWAHVDPSDASETADDTEGLESTNGGYDDTEEDIVSDTASNTDTATGNEEE